MKSARALRRTPIAVIVLLSLTACDNYLGGINIFSALPQGPIESITLAPRSATIQISDIVQIHATLLDADGMHLSKGLDWATSNRAIAQVECGTEQHCVIRGVSKGTAIITARGENRRDSMTVNVIPVPVATIILSDTILALTPLQSAHLGANVVDAKGRPVYQRTITWTSSDNTVAIVSDVGLVSALGPGIAIITATVEGVTATSTVTVTPSP